MEEIKINDKEREKFFIDSGYSIIRFSNKQVHNEIEFILEEINSLITKEIKTTEIKNTLIN